MSGVVRITSPRKEDWSTRKEVRGLGAEVRDQWSELGGAPQWKGYNCVAWIAVSVRWNAKLAPRPWTRRHIDVSSSGTRRSTRSACVRGGAYAARGRAVRPGSATPSRAVSVPTCGRRGPPPSPRYRTIPCVCAAPGVVTALLDVAEACDLVPATALTEARVSRMRCQDADSHAAAPGPLVKLSGLWTLDSGTPGLSASPLSPPGERPNASCRISSPPASSASCPPSASPGACACG